MKKILLILFRVISIFIIIICLGFLYEWKINNDENLSIINEIESYSEVSESVTEKEEKIELLTVDFESLKQINNEIVAWVKVNNTNIDFPIVQTKDNTYYLKHNLHKESNGAGWIFADYRNSFENLDDNTIIYGHNRRNGSMFSNLNNLIQADWNFEGENSYILFATEKESFKAEIFSVYKESENTLTMQNNFGNNEEFEKYIISIKEKSIKKFENVEVFASDKILTLCTCDNTNKNRIVVHAKLVK